MTTITIDGKNEEDFRREVESDLRHGREAAAADRLRKLLAPHAGPGRVLPDRFLTVTADELSLRGWNYLGDCISRHDRPGRPVTALSIAFGWAGEDLPAVDDQGRLHPHIETGYFNDAAYPFSQSGRDDLLDGYSLHGCTWASDCEASDNALSLDGIDDLYGALAMLEACLLASDEPDPEEIAAGSLGACLLSVLLFQAVSQKIKQDGLPRPVCVTAGSNGVYPYFDAPVVGMPETVRRATAKAEEEEAEAEVDVAIPGPRYSSLLMTGIPRAQKRAVLVLAETEQEMAGRIARLRGHGDSAELSEPALEAELPATEMPLPAVLEDVSSSPLLTKKPSGQSWDFRDMLGPPPEDRISADDRTDDDFSGVFEPESDLETEPMSNDWPAHAEIAPPEAEAPAIVTAPTPSVALPESESGDLREPGFPLMEDPPQGPVDVVLSPDAPIARDEPVKAEPWLAEQAGPVWPFAIDMALADRQVSASPAALSAPEPAPGLWARLRKWILPKP